MQLAMRRCVLLSGGQGVGWSDESLGDAELKGSDNVVNLLLKLLSNVLTVVLADVVLVTIALVVLFADGDGVVGEKDVTVIAVAFAHSGGV